MQQVCVYTGDALAAYNFGSEHPFGPLRHEVFVQALHQQGLADRVCLRLPKIAPRETLLYFHTQEYIEKVERLSKFGVGLLDHGDTPAFQGMFEAAASVVGSVLDAIEQIMAGQCRHAFVPIAGLHHARRGSAAGFCVFNDCGIAIEQLRRHHAVNIIAYVDIDAHHGDGVYYGFVDEPWLCYVDFHEDGRYLYPGTGAVDETGQGAALGTKLNVPMPPGANDQNLFDKWPAAERFIENARPEFIILQCGADSLSGDPITDMQFTSAAHAWVTQRLKSMADRLCGGRLLAVGGGGYNLDNIAQAWCAVVNALLDSNQGNQ